MRRGNLKAAQTLCQEALRFDRRVGSLQGEASSLFLLGETARVSSEHDRAEALLQQALSQFRQLGQAVGAANCLESLGLNAFAQSNPAQARPWLEESLRLNQDIPRPLGIGHTHLSIAKLFPPGSPERRQHIEDARRAWEEADLLDQLRHELDAVPVE